MWMFVGTYLTNYKLGSVLELGAASLILRVNFIAYFAKNLHIIYQTLAQININVLTAVAYVDTS